MEKLPTEIQKKIFSLHRKFGKTIEKYGLIEDGDSILIGLSGGKDSLALVEFLGERMKIFKPKFSVYAVHISVENIQYNADIQYLKNYCDAFNIPFYHETTSFDSSTDKRKTPCFLCSWTRRKALFETAKKLGCNKIALGHHQDDILETLLMNMTCQGAISTMPPLLKMIKFDMSIIRPMCLLSENEITELGAIRKFKKQIKNCPYEKVSNRAAFKKIVSLLNEINPEARYSLWNSMTNIQKDYLPKIKQTRENI